MLQLLRSHLPIAINGEVASPISELGEQLFLFVALFLRRHAELEDEIEAYSQPFFLKKK